MQDTSKSGSNVLRGICECSELMNALFFKNGIYRISSNAYREYNKFQAPGSCEY